MHRQLPFKALNQRNSPLNISFQSAYQLQDFVKKFLYRYFFNVQTKKPDRFRNLCMEHMFLIGLTLSSLSICEDELWYMWCLTTLYATKLVFLVKPILTHLTTLEFSPDLLWTLLEWYSPLTWWRPTSSTQKQETSGHKTWHMNGELTLIHDTSVTSVLKAYLMELNNVPPPAANIHYTSIGPSWSRETFSFMASPSSFPPSNPVTLSSTLSLPKSCTSHTTNKIENLVEYSYIPESAQISESSYPLISPYQLYKHPSSFTRSIHTLISTRRPQPKEYTQSSRLDQCALQATSAEQYVTLEIPSELIFDWKREGYTHLHLGGIRLILTLHGRKGLPVTARIAMLDTRFKQYQDAVIGTVLTTLHAGSVLLTFYPNFNLSLQDTNLPTTLKVQVQIQGVEQISSAKIATLHHQMVYRLQNHALDLPNLEHHSDTLMVLAESDQIPAIIQIPRQLPRHELIKLMPLEWISNYEQFHTNTAPIQTSESMFERRQDGTVRMTFKPPPSAPQEPPRLSFTYSSMITAIQTGSGLCDPNCPCWDDWEEDDDYATKKRPKKKKPPISCHHCKPKSPKDPPPPPAPLPIYKKELKWIAKHCKPEIPSPIPHSTPLVQPLACMMFSSTFSDSSSFFPPLETHTDSHRNVVSKPFIPSAIPSTGHLEPPKPFESVLNWQTQNARAQNDTLLHINSKVEKISLQTEQIETKVDTITAQM
ncbi:hypothetical protein KPL70_025938 [Citrus sinensis]|nr:hypothetical protein KPL70_025938 [Citrus sinensis]